MHYQKNECCDIFVFVDVFVNVSVDVPTFRMPFFWSVGYLLSRCGIALNFFLAGFNPTNCYLCAGHKWRIAGVVKHGGILYQAQWSDDKEIFRFPALSWQEDVLCMVLMDDGFVWTSSFSVFSFCTKSTKWISATQFFVKVMGNEIN